MPWLALPYDLRKNKDQVSEHFGVQGIPTFVMLDKDWSPITKSGIQFLHLIVTSPTARGAVMSDPEGKEFPWIPKPLGDLANPDGINDSACVIAFMEEADEVGLPFYTFRILTLSSLRLHKRK